MANLTLTAPAFDPYAERFDNLTPELRAQIRAAWFWRDYLRNTRAQLRMGGATPAERRALARFAVQKAKAGYLPRVEHLAREYRLWLKQQAGK